MTSPKNSGPKKSDAPPPLQKAVPPPDNPLLRFQAEEGPRLEGGDSDTKEQARLRAKAFEQLSRKSSDPNDKPDTPAPPD
jgi:hypothetical protein